MLETKRTILRPIRSEDNEEVFKYRSDSETNKYQGWIPISLDDVSEFIAKNPSEFNLPDTWFQLVITEKDSGKIIGDIGIHFIGNQQAEIGCTLAKYAHGNGYASEALKAVIDYLFKKLNKHRIIGSIDPKNENSIKLLERLGFRKEAHFKQSLYIKGSWVDDIIYATLNTEWN
jgi:RimJ/RimL family protein N-acetyltransferase